MSTYLSRTVFKQALALCQVGFSYTALTTELDPITVPEVNEFLRTHPSLYAPVSASQDPIFTAHALIKQCSDKQVVVFLPGREFDFLGTRHGRGGGWYDRFLSELPPTFLRVGLSYEKNISHRALVRQAWDEPVDWLIYQSDSEWIFHQTQARPLIKP